MARMKKNKTPDDNKFDVRRITADASDAGKTKLSAKSKQSAERLNKMVATKQSK